MKSADRLRRTGISVIDSLPWGTHFCQFYQTKQDLLDVVTAYLKAGLENGEFCMWVTAEPVTVEEAKQALIAAMPEADQHILRGDIEILPHTEWYLNGPFDRHKVLSSWIDKLNHAIKQGYNGIRVSGDTMWLEKSHWLDFTEYEASINDCIKDHPLLVLCTYCLDKCGASEIADVIKNHEFALIKRDGKWTVIESSEHRKMEEKIRYQNAILEGINRIFSEALNCKTLEELGRTCLAVAEEVTGSQFGFIREIDAEGKLDGFAISGPGCDMCEMADLVKRDVLPVGPESHDLYGRVIKDRRGFFINDLLSQPDNDSGPEGHAPVHSFLAAPLLRAGKVIGVLGLGNREDGYRNEDLEAVEALAAPIVQVFMRQRVEQEKEDLLRRERHIAETLQEAIIPSEIPSQIPHCRIGAAYQPALREAEIGGDFYDIFQIDKDRYGILIGDIAGKGLGAAVRVAAARHTIRSYAMIDPRPGRVLSLANNALCKTECNAANMMTVFFGVFDTNSRSISFVSAGHEPPVVFKGCNEAQCPSIFALPLGILSGIDYPEVSLSLSPGQRVVLVTDGVIEARNTGGLYSRERLVDYVLRHRNSDPATFASALLNEVNDYAGGHTQDDAAIIVLDIE